MPITAWPRRARGWFLLLALAGGTPLAHAQSPYLVKDIAPGSGSSGPRDLIDVGGTLLLSANGRLWRSDGTTSGTVEVKNVGILPRTMTSSKGVLLFGGSDSATGQELWRSDGTAAGTFMVKDIRPGFTGSTPLSSSPDQLTDVDGTLFFIAFVVGTSGGPQLWKSDGTGAGTVPVRDLNLSGASSGARLTAAGGLLFFQNCDTATGCELWRSDGTAAGTMMVEDIYPGSSSPSLNNMIRVGNTLFFTAIDGVHGNELWKSDGTANGTVMVKDIHPTGESSPLGLIDVNGTLFFDACAPGFGCELWKSDGSDAGTTMVKDINPGPFGSNPIALCKVGSTVFFFANDVVSPFYGTELWKSNGTASGTVMVKDINPSGDSTPLTAFMWELNGVLIFAANDGSTGDEPWKSDGTVSGTVRLGDIRPGSFHYGPRYGARSGDRLFFAADDGANGEELWAVHLPTVSIDDRAVGEGSAVNAAFRVFLSSAGTSTVTVQYGTANDTASSGSDFTAASGTLTFSPGRTQHSVFVTIVTDTTAEGSESFFVNLGNPSNAALGTKAQGIGTITDPPAAAKIAMYRSYNKSTDYHFFTTDLSSKNFAVNVLGFQDESNPIPFYVWNVMQSGATPLFRMYNPNLGRHFYTASSGSRDFIMGIGGLYEKEEGFVFPLSTSPVPSGATELFLLYNNNSGTHLFSADANQKNAILSLFQGVWVQHTSVGYVFTSP